MCTEHSLSLQGLVKPYAISIVNQQNNYYEQSNR